MNAERFEQPNSRELQNAAPGEGLSFRQIMDSAPNFGDMLNRTDNCGTKNILPNLTIEKCVSNEVINNDNSLSSSRDVVKRSLSEELSQMKPEKPNKPFPKPGQGGIKDCLPDRPQRGPINSLEGTPIEAKPYPPKQ
jgi:hypothetical protein